MLEEIATTLLRPNFPVVTLKKLNFVVREEIIQRKESFPFTFETKNLNKTQDFKNIVDQNDVKELVFSLVS
jgi:hypothetical protein